MVQQSETQTTGKSGPELQKGCGAASADRPHIPRWQRTRKFLTGHMTREHAPDQAALDQGQFHASSVARPTRGSVKSVMAKKLSGSVTGGSHLERPMSLIAHIVAPEPPRSVETPPDDK